MNVKHDEYLKPKHHIHFHIDKEPHNDLAAQSFAMHMSATATLSVRGDKKNEHMPNFLA